MALINTARGLSLPRYWNCRRLLSKGGGPGKTKGLANSGEGHVH